jgi:hypothetical protein
MNPIRVRMLAAAVVAGAAVAASPAAAQSPIPFAVEARGGLAFPAADLNPHAEMGVGYGATVTVQLLPNYGLYGGWSRTEFPLEQEGARATDSGFALGLTAAYPGLLGGVTPYFGSGILFHDLEVENLVVPEGDRGLGVELGGGVVLPLGQRVRVTPGLGYRWYTAPFVDNASATISYLSVSVGLNYSF